MNVSVSGLVAEYTTVLNNEAFEIKTSSLNANNLEVTPESFQCYECDKTYSLEEVCVMCSFSNMVDMVRNFVVISYKNPDGGNLVATKIVHKDQIEEYQESMKIYAKSYVPVIQELILKFS
jgi:hypothetical protein